MRSLRCLTLVLCTFGVAVLPAAAADNTPPEGFISLFNGHNLDGWKIPSAVTKEWKVIDGVIDCSVLNQKPGDKSLWSEKKFRDFVLLVDWRIKETPYTNPNVPHILPDGLHKKGPDGKEIKLAIPDSDSGIYVRGEDKCQVNIWCWPIGSGEVYGYRMDPKMPKSVRAGVTPKMKADKPIGEWNHFEITVKGDRLWVKLNGEEVIANAELPGMPAEGPVALQHHGGYNAKTKKYTGPPSLVQFKNVYIKEIK